MKLNAIKAVCTKAKKFVLYTDFTGKAVWIGTDSAIYPIDGILIDENSIESLFDLQESKLEKLTIETLPLLQCPLEADFNAVDEDRLMCVGYAVFYGGALNRILSYNEKLYSVDVDRLKPAEISSDYVRYYFSTNTFGEPVIVVRDGLVVTGVLKPNDASITLAIREQGRALGNLEIELPPVKNEFEQLELKDPDPDYYDTDDQDAVQNDTIQVCRVCGCDDLHACPGGCYWVEFDLCSQCAAKLAEDQDDGD